MNNAADYLVGSGESTVATEAKETFVAFVLDESGSMGGKEESVIKGFNDQLQVLKDTQEEAGDVRVALYKFGSPPDSRPRRLFRNKRPNEIRDLSNENYNPAMMTPLNDAVAMAINDLKRHDKADESNRAFLVVVLTDGQENASLEFDGEQIADLIGDLQDTGRWTITFVGAEFDPRSLASTRDVYAGNMSQTSSVKEAMDVGTRSLHAYMATTRGAGATATSSYYDPSSTDDDDSDITWTE